MPILMIPGPTELHEDVVQAMASPGISHVDPSFIATFGESLKLLRDVALTKSAQPFILAGSGTLSWDMLVCNVMEKGDRALIVNTGYFGDGYGDCFKAYGFEADHVRCAVGHAPTTQAIVDQLKKHKYKVITITHVDTSTGVLTNIKDIASAVRQASPDTLIAVDGVCSFAGERFHMDEWQVDYMASASQKALGCPSGLCVALASERMMNVFNSRKTPVANYYLSWTKWLPIMKAYENKKPSYFATPAVSLVIALNVSLKQVLSKGMEWRFQQHEKESKRLKQALVEAGLKLVPQEDCAANTLTAVYYPESKTAADVLPKVKENGVILAGGLHKEIAPKYFRIGHMGVSVTEPERGHMDKTIAAVLKSIK